jgi:GNAT superfamily N-acetyltransferase
VRHPWGLQLRTPSLPLTRNLNALYVEGALDGIDVGALDPVAIYVTGDDTPPPGPEWARERGVFMAHRGPRPEPDPRVGIADRASLAGLRREWLEAEIPVAEIVTQLLTADERLFTTTPTVAFAVGGEAQTLLLGAPGTAVRMVEDVYTTPSARRRGHAGALVRTAVAAAYAEGAELVFLPTAAGPRAAAHRLYAALGFADIAHTSMFWRHA